MGEGGESVDLLHQDLDAGEPRCAGQEDLSVAQVRETQVLPEHQLVQEVNYREPGSQPSSLPPP